MEEDLEPYQENLNKSFQSLEATKLLEKAQVSKNKPCGIDEYRKFQAVLAPNYLIKVHSPHLKDGLIFKPQFQMTRDTKVIHISTTMEKIIMIPLPV